MPLPHWTAENLLPPGRHPADLSDLYERCVWDAPRRNERENLFGALSGYLGVVTRLVPTGRAWISGGFTTRYEDGPYDVDVLLLPDDWGSLKRLDGPARAAFYGLLTLRGVIVEQPVMYLDQVQPVGGLLDGFLCHPGDEEAWAAAWSTVRGPHGPVDGLAKGFVEVTW
ncbi:hypothetical protein SAMN05421810_102765 [Amycolatopsis arida]|uniref:Uncharacterized protein n=1 Tax=Amycolatopsis arida TaxID=587909 RepID=A0A1I5QUE6_9PSEU|nr:hypothetical protein [Amycolatopsis arida]TDX98967.1 hypothetical protein CLV69_101766 [Amycolatopsis arida]SFP49914.1 hypothetical protein SAMN05421810_102765 [Amycolatopsis arida]